MSAIDDAALASLLAGGQVADLEFGADHDWPSLATAGVKFVRCTFTAAAIANADLEDTEFDQCVFDRCRFSHSKVRNAAFDRCIFLGPDDRTAGCAFSFCDLRSVRLSHCDLSSATFDRSRLFAIEADNCRFVGAKFTKVDFSHSYGRSIVEHRASFQACTFELASLASASLREADLTGCRFPEADLSAADLTDAVLRDSELFQAVTSGAILDGADLRGAEISGLDLMALGSFSRMKIDDTQAKVLLESSGVVVDVGKRKSRK